MPRATRYVPLRLALIEEGRYLTSIDEAIADATGHLAEYVQKYGHHKSKKAKVEVSAKIIVEYVPESETDDSPYRVKASISTKLPGRPSSMTVAMDDEDVDGNRTLIVRASGSSRESPRQSKLCTDDGRPIDVETGEILPTRELGQPPKVGA